MGQASNLPCTSLPPSNKGTTSSECLVGFAQVSVVKFSTGDYVEQFHIMEG